MCSSLPTMADSRPSTPSSPVARSNKPASEALLNDKVGHKPFLTIMGARKQKAIAKQRSDLDIIAPILNRSTNENDLLVGPCPLLLSNPVISRPLFWCGLLCTPVQAKGLASVGRIGLRSWKGLGRSGW